MRVVLPMYEGDSIIHYGSGAALPRSYAPTTETVKPSLWAAASRAVTGFFDWLERSAERARYRQLEDYLADSGDIFELERRIRRLERGCGASFDPYS